MEAQDPQLEVQLIIHSYEKMSYNETPSYDRRIIVDMLRLEEDLPSVERLRAVLKYDPDSGNFYRVTKGDVRLRPTGSKCRAYRVLCVDGARFFAHRAAWAIHYGEWPSLFIDHINGEKSDNRIENLRLASKRQNNHNRGKTSANTSGLKGVYWHKAAKKWYSIGKAHGKQRYLGLYETPEEASEAYKAFSKIVAGEFMRTE